MTPQQRAYLQFIAEKGKKTQQQTDQYKADMNRVEPKKEVSFDQWKASRIPKLAIGGQGQRNWIEPTTPLSELMTPIYERMHGSMEPEEAMLQMQKTYTPENIAEWPPHMKQHLDDSMKLAQRKAAVNKWIKGNLTNYVKKQMGTREDPIRILAEQGITHLPVREAPTRHISKRNRETYGGEVLGQSEQAKNWEDIADMALEPWTLENLRQNNKDQPWMSKLPEDAILTAPSSGRFEPAMFGFDHIIDVLKEDLEAGRIRPEQLNKMSMEQAVRRVHQYDQEKAKAMRETALKQTEGMPVIKEYDSGHKWIELAPPQIDELPEGWKIKESNGAPFLENPKGENTGYLDKDNVEGHAKWSVQRELLDNALKYEGDTMGHCVGGYGEKVQEGRSRIFSLRDEKGEPHVTIETAPGDLARAFGNLPEDERRDIEQHVKTTQFGGAMPGRSNEDAYWKALDDEYIRRHGEPPAKIIQIKGKQNQKPKPQYMKMARDFVQSGNWSDIGDYQNAGLIRLTDGSDMAKALKAQGKPVPKYITESEHADWMASQLEPPKMAKGGQPPSMYSPLDKLASESPRAKGTPAEFMAEISKKPGFRQEEVADRKIPMPNQKMSKQQFIEHLNTAPAPLLDETVLGGDDRYWNNVVDALSSQGSFKGFELTDDGLVDKYGDLVSRSTDPMDAADHIVKATSDPETKYEEYKLPGSSNYREVLMKLPQNKRILAKARTRKEAEEIARGMNTQTNIVEPTYSWKDQDYKVEDAKANPDYDSPHWDEPNVLAHLRLSDRQGPKNERLLHIEEMQSDWHQEGRKKGYKGNLPAGYSVIDDMEAVPDAPFKKSWHELALKRAIKEAVEGGYKGIVITPGKEQNDRYSLSKHIDNLDYAINQDGSFDVVGHKGGKDVLQHHGIKPEELDKYVGKEVAKQMVAGSGETKTYKSRFTPEQGRNWNSLSGLQLEVGGEGMKGFYDKIVPDYLNKLGKKYGVKTGQMQIKNPLKGQSITDMLRAEQMTENDWQDMSPDERTAMIDRHDQRAKNNMANLHHFPITEEMRQDIKQNGLPLYKKGGGIKLLPTRFKE